MRKNREFGWEEVGPSQEGERFTFSDEAVNHMVDINERFKALQVEHPIVRRNSDYDMEEARMLNEIYSPLMSEVIYFASQSGLMIVFDWMSWAEGNYWLRSERPNKWEEFDVETARMMVTALVRSDYFSYSMPISFFGSGNFFGVFDHLTNLLVRGYR
ncbi:hypothetical protein CDES_06705 [Corynebacterium deserti GIMN1.010]|uniref:Uncharacterized protein n=1 Tax=Corynebacterium deserti GIMN1.010 TaxID=931089 RepID=A0A0M4CI92_9CORY|nr:DUF6508 domain-containing protein [Corynebacterium deserti]ALC05758.1 hypothetical protein CDES_06705 [Corynebacterium deserti GIMN1.010]